MSNYYTEEDVEYDVINFMDKEFMGISIKLWLLLIIVIVCIQYSQTKNNKGQGSSVSGTNYKPHYGYY